MSADLLLGRFDGMPILAAPGLAPRFTGCLAGLAATEQVAEMLAAGAGHEGAAAGDGFWPSPNSWMAAYRPYVVRDGMLQIPVRGILLHAFSFAVGSFATGYVYIQRALERGLADPEVRGIAFLCDSPGGEVAGNFELADNIFAARGKKPLRAFAHEMAYSAAYSLASAADRIVMSRTGGVGSIGVVTSHVDISQAMEKAGAKVTFIYAGKHKVDGNAYEPLPEDVKARIQERVDHLYGIFVAAVARNRALSAVEVRATEALTFMAPEAMANHLADAVGPLDDAVAEFAAELKQTEEDDQMSEKTQTPSPGAAGAAAGTGIDQTIHDQAVAAARAEGKAEGLAEGAAAERERILGIEANALPGHEKLVAEMKADGKTSPDQAAARILAAEKETRSRQMQGIKDVEKVTGEVRAAPTGGQTETGRKAPPTPAGWKAEWEGSEDLQAEFASPEAYVAYKSAEKDGRARLLTRAA